MKIGINQLKQGDKVSVYGNSGFCHDSIGIVKAIHSFIDRTNDKIFTVIELENGHFFDSRTCEAMNIPTAYFIKPTEQ